MNNSTARNGNFTSSEIVSLTANGKAAGSIGKPFYTYIEECNMERRLERSLTDEVNARPLSWGHLVERVAHEVLPIDYQLCSKETLTHPDFDFWAGSPDGIKYDEGKTVTDIKSPLTLKSFCQLVDPYMENGKVVHKGLTIEAVRANHKDGDKYYWQLVSNSILTNSKFAELIVFCPYQSQLQDIRALAVNSEGAELTKYYWIVNSQDEELPYLIEGGHYKNINIIRWEVSETDKKFLTDRVIEAAKLLIPKKVLQLETI